MIYNIFYVNILYNVNVYCTPVVCIYIYVGLVL